MNTIIEKIKAEIERLKGICSAQIKENPGQTFPFVMEMTGYDKLLSVLSNIEKEEKPTNIDFEQELYKHFGQVKDFTLGMRIGKYFYELGKQSGSSEIPNDLEEAAQKWSKENTRGFVLKDKTTRYVGDTIDAFIAGAKWQAEQDKETIELAEEHAYLAGAVNEREKMMKDAVEGKIAERRQGKLYARCQVPKTMKVEFCDKVRVIIVKED